MLFGTKDDISKIKDAVSKKQITAETGNYITTELGKPDGKRKIKRRELNEGRAINFDS